MRAGTDARQLRFGPFPGGERIANGIFAHLEAGSDTQELEPCVGFHVRLTEDDARDAWLGCTGKAGQRFELGKNLHREGSGCRFQSL